jgi:hypothetical protein
MSGCRYRRVGLGAGAAFGAAAFAAPAAHAVDIPVTNLNDDNAGSLRAAIAAANMTAASDDITFQSGLSGQITLTTGEIPITQPLNILGPGATQITVSGNADGMGFGDSRIFYINLATAGQAVSISGLTMTEGLSGTSPPNGGAILNLDSFLTVVDSTVTNSNTDPMDGSGGGISTGGQLRVERSTISGNTNAVEGGSGTGYGGGIAVYGTSQTDIVDSTISGNQGSVGGGIWTMSTGALNITGSTIAENSGALGGGVSDAGGALTLQSTLAGNNGGNSDVSSPAANVGFSLIESSDVMALTATGPNIIGVDPQLDSLANHGGPTETHLPAGTSPAIDKGHASGLTFDQPGLARTQDFGTIANAAGGDGTDIGSIERQLLEPGPGPIVGQAKSGRLCLGERATIIGTKGKDKLRGTPERDVISGKRGNDTIVALEGNDLICGDKGKDRIKGGAGDDTARGGNGGDSMRGGDGGDTLRGGGGPDSLFGDAGDDALFGGSKSGARGGGGGGGGPAVNRCDGGEGTDAATGCERTVGVP